MRSRRYGVTATIEHNQQKFSVTYNINPDAPDRYAECFYCDDGAIKHGSDVQPIISDACISISKRLEAGETFAQVAASFGENRLPGQESGPPSSLLGAIARMGTLLDEELK